jgi:hypothetical protein
MDSLRVLGNNRAVWLNLTSSGNESAAHVVENDRMPLIFCAFEGSPLILRLYERAQVIHPRDPKWSELYPLLPDTPGARQIFDMQVDIVQESCGNAVPLFNSNEQRDILEKWAERRGEQGLQEYWEDRNQESIYGKPTDILASPNGVKASA